MNKRVKKMILVSIFAAMSVVLYIFPKFSLPMFPKFLEINFSMLPAYICGFALGPFAGLVCIILRFVMNVLLEGSSSSYVGEVADLIMGGFTIVGASCAYRFLPLRGQIRSITAFLIGMATWCIVAVITNAFFSIPLYLEIFFGGNVNYLVGALKVIPGVNANNYMGKYLLLAVLPFNLMISFVVSLVTYFVNRRVEIVYNRDIE